MYLVISFDINGTSEVQIQAAFKSRKRADDAYRRVVSQNPDLLVELIDVFDEFELPRQLPNRNNLMVSRALFWGECEGHYRVVHSTNRSTSATWKTGVQPEKNEASQGRCGPAST